MKPSRAQLYREQRSKLSTLRAARSGRVAVAAMEDDDQPISDNLLAQFVAEDEASTAALRAPVTVSTAEASALLDQLRKRWDVERLEQLLGDCRSSVIRGIAGPFGLGRVAAAADKVGGNVTTVHNAKQDIYASEDDQYKRSQYAGAAYEKARDTYRDGRILPNSQMVQDEYSGDYIDYSEADCDHTYATKRYHQEGGFMQTAKQKSDFGSDPDNFAMTHQSGNRSKLQKDMDEWQGQEATDRSGRSNKERYGHDNRRVNPAVVRGKETAARHAPTARDKAGYYGKRAATTGLNEAGKMGLQQALGLLLTEFLTASFDEILDAYRHGMRANAPDDSFFAALRRRLSRVAKRVSTKWQGALAAFKDGAISGFLSNLVTMLINMLITTGKRVVRVIREGLLSILSALKMALFPPKGMSRAEAGDAALKLLATGLVTSLGIMAEEVCEKAVTAFFSTHLPFMAPLAVPVSAVLVATMTGIASALLVYWLDRIDIFGVREKRDHARTLEALDQTLAEGEGRIDALLQLV